MYSIDSRDTVVPLDAPPMISSSGASTVVSVNDRLVLVYSVAPVARDASGEIVAIEFILPRAHMLGAPNDEALAGHPLAARGLQAYSAHEVRDSSWIRALETLNRVHRLHSASLFAHLRHFIFTFQDETFECVARDLQVHLRESAHVLLRDLASKIISLTLPP